MMEDELLDGMEEEERNIKRSIKRNKKNESNKRTKMKGKRQKLNYNDTRKKKMITHKQ